jgi:hypothetical protein
MVPIAKLRDYSLNPDHPRARHKARVFRSALGLGQSDAARLAQIILQHLVNAPARPVVVDRYGSRYEIDLLVSVGERNATLRTGWIIPTGEMAPRLTTCFVLT